jgi:hypothetical protein
MESGERKKNWKKFPVQKLITKKWQESVIYSLFFFDCTEVEKN